MFKRIVVKLIKNILLFPGECTFIKTPTVRRAASWFLRASPALYAKVRGVVHRTFHQETDAPQEVTLQPITKDATTYLDVLPLSTRRVLLAIQPPSNEERI